MGTSQQPKEQQADSRRIQQQTRDRAAATAALSSKAPSQQLPDTSRHKVSAGIAPPVPAVSEAQPALRPAYGVS